MCEFWEFRLLIWENNFWSLGGGFFVVLCVEILDIVCVMLGVEIFLLLVGRVVREVFCLGVFCVFDLLMVFVFGWGCNVGVGSLNLLVFFLFNGEFL